MDNMTVKEALAIILDLARRIQENNAAQGIEIPYQNKAIRVAKSHLKTLRQPRNPWE